MGLGLDPLGLNKWEWPYDVAIAVCHIALVPVYAVASLAGCSPAPYDRKTNKKGQATITVEKCAIIVLYAHGDHSNLHTFEFEDGGCSYGVFVGCYAKATNERIPESNRLPDAPMIDWQVISGGSKEGLPEREQMLYHMKKVREEARKKANEMLSDEKKCCEEVKIRYVTAQPPIHGRNYDGAFRGDYSAWNENIKR